MSNKDHETQIHFVHGDYIGDNKYYCRRCDAPVEKEHFLDFKSHNDLNLIPHLHSHDFEKKLWDKFKADNFKLCRPTKNFFKDEIRISRKKDSNGEIL